MARKPRMLVEDATYHVTAKANRGEFIMDNDSFKQLLMEVIKQAKDKYDFELTNLTIMSNHVHFMIKPKDNLSKIMQYILGVFAIRFNKLNNLHGHVWYDRFKSKVINSVLQFVRTFIYICENPVRAQIVPNVFAYQYSAINMLRSPDYGGLFTLLPTRLGKIIGKMLNKLEENR